jgi:hypothetical protein
VNIEERESFEAWCRKRWPLCQFQFRRTGDGGYAAGEVDRMWKGWNARATEGDRQQRAAPVSADEAPRFEPEIPPSLCVCDEQGEICGIPRSDTGLIHQASGYCVRCGHKSACHHE